MINLSSEEIFTKIYQSNYWKDKESVSGKGSNKEQTRIIRKELPMLLRKYGIRSVLDAPCGDYHWMQFVSEEIDQYYGVDIVQDLIQLNKDKYEKKGIVFIHADITRDPLPSADLVIVRDLFIHLSDEDVFRALENLKKTNSTYLLTTTFLRSEGNYNIHTGSWRPINLQISPFNFPPPLFLIAEQNTEHQDRYADKSLGLWKFSDL